MPFTPAHAVAVLPLRGRRLGVPLLTTPLVAGSVAPDLPSFVGLTGLRATSHHWSGVVTVDVVMAAVAGLVWTWMLAAPVADVLPAGIRSRLRERVGLPGAVSHPLVLVASWLLSTAVGAATHVVWDSCTHRDGAVVRLVPALTQEVLGLPVDSWLQYLSGVLGTALLLVLAARWAHRTPPGRGDDPLGGRTLANGRAWRPLALTMLLVLACAGALLRAVPAVQGLEGSWRLQVGASSAAFGAGGAVMLWAVLYASWWWASSKRPEAPDDAGSQESVAAGVRGSAF